MSAEHGVFVKLEPGITGQQTESIEEAIGLIRGVESVTETDIPTVFPDRKDPGDLNTMAKILQACHSLPPTQLRRLLGHLHHAVAQTPALLELQGDKEFLSTAEVGVMWGVSPHRVRTLIREGKLPATTDEHGYFRIAASDLANDPRKPTGRPPKSQ